MKDAVQVLGLILIANVIYFISGGGRLSSGCMAYVAVVWLIDIARLLIEISLLLKRYETESKFIRGIEMAVTILQYLLTVIAVYVLCYA